MSTIIWVLVIVIPSSYCAATVEVTFRTERECVRALDGVDRLNRGMSKCIPRKASDSGKEGGK